MPYLTRPPIARQCRRGPIRIFYPATICPSRPDLRLRHARPYGFPHAEIGRALVRYFLLNRGEGGDLPALLRTSVTREPARQRLLQKFREQVAPALAKICGAERVTSGQRPRPMCRLTNFWHMM